MTHAEIENKSGIYFNYEGRKLKIFEIGIHIHDNERNPADWMTGFDRETAESFTYTRKELGFFDGLLNKHNATRLLKFEEGGASE